jgi:hypothetical protein
MPLISPQGYISAFAEMAKFSEMLYIHMNISWLTIAILRDAGMYTCIPHIPRFVEVTLVYIPR